ncbi:MAG: N-acyl-D-aspartate/D-glutamate deacylase [Candidatus Azotimanducaceae bacterium]|jgi:N-acyl-D-amino-acid deacylase
MHDLVIRGGMVVDGTGGPAQLQDVAVDGKTITAVGADIGPGREEIDATGLLVTPGWVDIHAHYDGQVTWDPYLTPAGWNGVTTVVIGNCGVGFAPVKPDQKEFLIQLMEGVEDIPGSALAEGIRWNWETFPEYLDALGAQPYVIDVGTQVPHGPVRTYVMGEQGAADNYATPEQIQSMAEIVKTSLDAGALGFSTSRTKLHRAKNGDLVPGTLAAREELLGIGRVLGEVGHGVFQMASDYKPEDYELGWMKQLSLETGCRILYSVVQSSGDPDQWRRLLRASEVAADEGALISPQIAPRPAGLLLGFESSVHPFMLHKDYKPLHHLSGEEKKKALANPSVRQAILTNLPDYDRFDGVLGMILKSFDMMYPLGKLPDYEPAPENSIAAIAAKRSCTPQEILYDVMMRDPGEDLVYLPMLGYSDQNLDATAELMRHPNTIYGLADGGAHCGVVSDASIPTFLLTHWARDRTRGDRIPIEELIHNQTSVTAKCYGLDDRGVIAPGMKADLNVIDFDKLQIHGPRVAYDLPAEGKRYLQDVTGYRVTICSGQIIYRDGKATGVLPGQLIRGPQSAATQTLEIAGQTT